MIQPNKKIKQVTGIPVSPVLSLPLQREWNYYLPYLVLQVSNLYYYFQL